MARPKKIALRTTINDLYLKHQAEFITKEATIRHIGELLSMSPYTVRYYVDNFATRRQKEVSEHIRHKVALMSIHEIKDYALKLGRNWQRLYQISLAARKASAGNKEEVAKRADMIRLLGAFNFTSPVDLKAVDLSIAEVRAAKTQLAGRWGLSLASPNLLVSPKGDRAILLTYQEQLKIVRAPVQFIQQNASDLGKRWRPYNHNMTAIDLLDLD